LHCRKAGHSGLSARPNFALEKIVRIFFLKIRIIEMLNQQRKAMTTTLKLHGTAQPAYTLTLFVRNVVHTVLDAGKPRLFGSISEAEAYASRFENSQALAGVRLYSIIEEVAS
jgi:hypothetical protein